MRDINGDVELGAHVGKNLDHHVDGVVVVLSNTVGLDEWIDADKVDVVMSNQSLDAIAELSLHGITVSIESHKLAVFGLWCP
jgi:hypothetical protein